MRGGGGGGAHATTWVYCPNSAGNSALQPYAQALYISVYVCRYMYIDIGFIAIT